MSVLVWDKSEDRRYESGVSKGVLFPKKTDGTDAYENGVTWSGLTGVTESPSGADVTDLWADNIKYASLRAEETFGATIEAYTYPDEFEECNGSTEAAEGVYIGQQKRRAFGFAYRTDIGIGEDSEAGYKLNLVYNATVSPSEKGYESRNDSPDAVAMSWEVSTTSVSVAGHKPTAHITIDSTKVKDKTKLKELEDKLYGTSDAEPTLPSPDEVLAIFAAA